MQHIFVTERCHKSGAGKVLLTDQECPASNKKGDFPNFFYFNFQSAIYFVQKSDPESSYSKTICNQAVKSGSKSENSTENLSQFPAWVTHPDFSRAEWLNEVIR